MWGRDELEWNVKSHVKCQQTDTTSYKVSKWILRGKFDAKWDGNLMGMLPTCATLAVNGQSICSCTTLKIGDFKQSTGGVCLTMQSSSPSCVQAILEVWQQMGIKMFG